MAKVRYTGSGATVEVEMTTDVWTDIGCTYVITAPPQEKSSIDVTCQQDTNSEAVQGIEELSRASFVEPYDYAATSSTIDTLYGSGDEKDWRLTFNGPGTDTMVVEFPAIVQSLVPNSAGGNDRLERTVTLLRTGAITHS